MHQPPLMFIHFTSTTPHNVLTHCILHAQKAKSHLHTCYECKVCNAPFKSKLEYTAHTREHMRVNTRAASRIDIAQTIKEITNTPFTCHYCPTMFHSKDNLLHHQQQHIPNKQSSCRLCTYSSHHACTVLEHIFQKHCTRTNLSCAVCPPTLTHFFKNSHEYLHHITQVHHNSLALTLLSLIPPKTSAPHEVFFNTGK